MTKRSIGRAMLHFYPKDVRENRGAEILGTVLDAGDASLPAFTRQLLSLASGGLRARATATLAVPPATLLANSVVWVAVIAIAYFPSVSGATLIRNYSQLTLPAQYVLIRVVLPLVVLALFTVGRRRAAGVLGLVWVVLSMLTEQMLFNPAMTAVDVIEFVVLVTPGFCLLTFRPQSTPQAFRHLWLIFALAWVIPLLANANYYDVCRFFPAVAIVFLPFAPEFALGVVAYWSIVLWSVAAGILSARGNGVVGPQFAYENARFPLLIWTVAVLALVAVGRWRATKRSYR